MALENPADGALQPARRALSDAIAALIDPKPETHDGELVWTDSLYHQLVDSVPGSKRDRTAGAAKSQPPIWIDATMLLTDIDATVRKWQHNPGIYDGDLSPEHPPTPATIRRLRIIDARTWRPQDVTHIDTITTQTRQWTTDILRLLTDEHPKTISAPCPACNKQTIHRRDSAGELVRQPALQITTQGCECMACHYNWGPEKFRFLAEVIGCELPEGVLE